MREESKKMYQAVKQDYSLQLNRSAQRSGSHESSYRQGDYDSVYNQYIELNRQGVPDSIRVMETT